ncbi:PadR family transcriptional regulator [Peribacillus sp. NPDC097895]|uniref:PadR family transcriptional regulator n=1 Tax=Peribacillus sp. NPDC097895 TaxID=3390619 RepID=UPI003D0076D2
MYEIFILSILMNFPAHAYLISKIIEPWFKISRGTLSTLLKKMLKDGYIEYTNEDIPFKSNHSSQTYKITSSGKERFFSLMLDTTESVNFIKLFHIKANNFGLLQASDR